MLGDRDGLVVGAAFVCNARTSATVSRVGLRARPRNSDGSAVKKRRREQETYHRVAKAASGCRSLRLTFRS